MSVRHPSSTRERALLALMDDPTPMVRESLLSEFSRLGPNGIEILRAAVRAGCGPVGKVAAQFLQELEQSDHARLLREFIRGMRYELETGLLLINRVVQPEASVIAVRRHLDRFARRCIELRVSPMAPREQCVLLNRVLFHEAGFRCSREGVPNTLNNCIEAVCERKRGGPLLLTAIYVLVGQRLGLELEPVALPGAFLVGCYCGASPFYVNPTLGGRFHDAEELEDYLSKREVCPDFCHLAPVPVGEVLRTCCEALLKEAEAQQDVPLAYAFAEFVQEFDASYRRYGES